MRFFLGRQQDWVSFSHSLPLKAIIVFLAFSLLPLTGIAIYSTIQNQQSITQQITGDQQKLAASQKVMVVHWLDNLKANLDTVETLESGRLSDLPQVELDLKRFKQSWGIYENIYITDLNGKQIAASLGTRLDLSDRDYFKHAISGELYISNVLVSKATGKNIIVISKPLVVDGKIAGVAAIACQTTALNDVLNVGQFSQSGESYLIDSNGVFITPSRFNNRLKNANLIKNQAETELKIDTFGSEQVLKGVSGVGQYKNYLGDQVLGTYLPIEGSGWGLLVEQNDQEIFTSMNQTRNIIILISFFTMVLIAVTALLISYRQKAMELIRAQADELMAETEELNSQNEELIEQDKALRNSEINIRRLNEDLEQRVMERTKELESANLELEAFTYSVSHDLRAPLRRITGYAQILAEDYAPVLDKQGREYLQRIQSVTRHMNELVEALLRLSRVSSSEIELSEVDLSSIARGIITNLKAAQPGRAVEFIIPPKLVAKADGKLMEILLENLFGNAWKFTSKHPAAQIELGIIEQDSHNTYFVRDDGAGFDPACAAKLFGVFQRLHSAHDFEGTGIGLALAQRIVHRHGGVIWAEGNVEQGAAFYFTLQQNRIL